MIEGFAKISTLMSAISCPLDIGAAHIDYSGFSDGHHTRWHVVPQITYNSSEFVGLCFFQPGTVREQQLLA